MDSKEHCTTLSTSEVTKKYDFQVGDMFHVPFTEAIVLITSLPKFETQMYRGIYGNDDIKERNIGTYKGLSDAIEGREWIYYPVVKCD